MDEIDRVADYITKGNKHDVVLLNPLERYNEAEPIITIPCHDEADQIEIIQGIREWLYQLK